ncbi:hypothetical protein [Cryptosporangium aurantiacum]|nr:hypothetical protein [Cryptosporangium aurantiacum]
MRLFLDHHETDFKRTYGKDSSEFARLKAAEAREYDAWPAYGIIYKLRDYNLHCGFPLDHIKMESTQDPSSEEATTVQFHLDRDELLATFDWKSKVTADLRALPRHFTIEPLIRDTIACFRRIYREVKTVQIEHAIQSSPEIIEAAERADSTGAPCLVEVEKTSSGIITNLKHHLLPVDFALRLRDQIRADEISDLFPELANDAVDPLADAEQEVDDPQYEASLSRGASLLSVFLQHGGPSTYLNDSLNRQVDSVGLNSMVAGLMNVATVAISMTASAIGTTPEAILGNISTSSTRHSRQASPGL